LAIRSELAPSGSAIVSALGWLTPQLRTASEAVRWACLMEATAPKAGNVSPGQSFIDLHYHDFVRASEIAANAFNVNDRFGKAIFSAVEQIGREIGTNVNLGILLLLGPLYQADQLLQTNRVEVPTIDHWKKAVATTLESIPVEDENDIFRAISISSAGGLGKADKWDVNQAHPEVNLMEAMRHAAGRDRVAKQYATAFVDLLDAVVPILRDSIVVTGDLLHGIVKTQMRLLAADRDTLISRKNGESVAEEVRYRASRVDSSDLSQRVELDEFLRSDGNRLNPGTTADLIAAALFVLFRSLPESRIVAST